MTAGEFSIWLMRMKALRGWSNAECARRLGTNPNSVINWSRRGCPRYIKLATERLEQPEKQEAAE
jgi:DNA-directed RNA polymerase specialized sigma24 family protein